MLKINSKINTLFKSSYSYLPLFIRINKISSSFSFLDKEKIEFVKIGGDLKQFGKKFSPAEMEKFMDPFGFLGPQDYQKVKEEMDKLKEENILEKPKEEEIKINLNLNEAKVIVEENTKLNEVKELPKEDIVMKLDNLELIKDPAKKADEKCKIMPTEYGYKYNGPEPTRYGDWDIKGKCVDF